LERISALESEISNFDKATHGIKSRVHELECYIEGRKSRWTEQNSKLEESKRSLAELANVISTKDEQLAAKDKEAHVLKDTIKALEDSVSKLDGRLQERNDAFGKFKESLQDQITVTERAKSDLSAREKELESLRAQFAELGQREDSQEQGIRERDSRIEQLEGKAAEQDRRADELEQENSRLTEELARLRDSIAERDAAIEGLNSQFEQAEAALSQTKAEVADIEAARSQLALDNAKNLDAAQELHNELSNVHQDRDRLAEQLASANETIDSLREKLTTAEDRETDIESKTAALHEQIERLQKDIKQKQEVIDAFDRGAQALNDLNRDIRDASQDRGRDPKRTTLIEASHLFEDSISHASQSESEAFEDESSARDDAQHLIVVSSGGKGVVVHKLTTDSVTIGRSNQCDIPLRDSAVSRIHARLNKCDSGFEIEDADSTNGLMVNKQKVQRAVLHHGDIISVAGRFHLKYL
jgi:chromosome segregation ATPase